MNKQIRLGTSCSWCDEINWQGERPWPYCWNCSHRADEPRMGCACGQCLRQLRMFNWFMEVGDEANAAHL